MKLKGISGSSRRALAQKSPLLFWHCSLCRPRLTHRPFPVRRRNPLKRWRAGARTVNAPVSNWGPDMHSFAAAGAGFLLAVLWFDLMFDLQTRKHASDPLPPEVLASISAYYRRVTTEAYPMNRLVALVMVLTLAAICTEIVQGENPWWIEWGRSRLPAADLCRP